MTDLHFTPSPFLQNDTQNMTDRKARGEHEDSLIFLPCNYLWSTQELLGEKRSQPSFCCSWYHGVKKDLPDSTCLTPHFLTAVQEQARHPYSLPSHSRRRWIIPPLSPSAIDTLELAVAPSYPGIGSRLSPSDFNSPSRASQNCPFFFLPLFGLRVKQWEEFSKQTCSEGILSNRTVCTKT